MWNIFKRKPAEVTLAPQVNAGDILSGTEMAMVAYKIENGYLIRIGNGQLGTLSTIIYCTNEQEISEKLIAHRAKQVMGVAKTDKFTVSRYASASEGSFTIHTTT